MSFGQVVLIATAIGAGWVALGTALAILLGKGVHLADLRKPRAHAAPDDPKDLR